MGAHSGFAVGSGTEWPPPVPSGLTELQVCPEQAHAGHGPGPYGALHEKRGKQKRREAKRAHERRRQEKRESEKERKKRKQTRRRNEK